MVTFPSYATHLKRLYGSTTIMFKKEQKHNGIPGMIGRSSQIQLTVDIYRSYEFGQITVFCRPRLCRSRNRFLAPGPETGYSGDRSSKLSQNQQLETVKPCEKVSCLEDSGNCQNTMPCVLWMIPWCSSNWSRAAPAAGHVAKAQSRWHGLGKITKETNHRCHQKNHQFVVVGGWYIHNPYCWEIIFRLAELIKTNKANGKREVKHVRIHSEIRVRPTLSVDFQQVQRLHVDRHG